MDKPTAIIDKSLFQRICDPQEKTELFMGLLRERYCLAVPFVMHGEVFTNLVKPPKDRPPLVFPEMVKWCKELHPFWMSDVLDIAYRELILGDDLAFVPWLDGEVRRAIFNFTPDSTAAVNFFAEYRLEREQQIERRRQWQNERIPPGKFFLGRDEKTFVQQLTDYFLKQLAQSASRSDILDTIFGDVFIQRHPEQTADIKATLSKISDSTINKYPFSRNCLIASFVYMIGPITKVLVKPGGRQQPVKVLDRQNQRNNLEDQEYVASAFLCERLLTGDQEMAKVMGMFEARGLWHGKTIWIDRQKDLASQIPALLI